MRELNPKEKAKALICSKFEALERQLVRRYRGCSVVTKGVRRSLRLAFMGDALMVVFDHDNQMVPYAKANTLQLVRASALVDELCRLLEVAVQELPVGYEQAVREITDQVDRLRELDVDELAD